MRRCFTCLVVLLILNVTSIIPAYGEPLSERLRHRLEFSQAGFDEATFRISLVNPEAVTYLYEKLAYQTLWLKDVDQYNAHADQLLAELHNAQYHGLDPKDYHLQRLNKLRNNKQGDAAGRNVDFELVLTDGLLLFILHSKYGKVNSETFQPRWAVNKELVDELLPVLQNRQETNLLDWLASIRPKSKAYKNLQQELARIINNPKPGLNLTETLKVGQSHPQVTTIARALNEFDYLKEMQEGSLYTSALKKALIEFQQDHSLEADGIVGPATRQALNALYGGDTNKLKVNMERWRWMPESLGASHIRVNIASFNLHYIYKGEPLLTMKTVVGRNYRKTPVFSGELTYVVVNPSWNVPHKIASQDLLPKIKANPDFLQSMGMILFEGWGQNQKQVIPEDVDWARVTPSSFPFHIRQQPGEKNALGKVKFMFPNEHSVYLHDTNDKTLFAKSSRAFSSGCIRLEKPIELLESVMQNHAKAAPPSIQKLLETGKESTLLLKEKIPVHIQYWTVWMDDDSRVHYRHDIYERDDAVLRGLNSPYLDEVEFSLLSN